ITSKGQVTLRRELLDQLGARPGGRIVVEPVAPGRVEIRRADRRGSLGTFVGCLKTTAGPIFSLEDIERIARELGGRALRITADTNVLVRAAVMDDAAQAQLPPRRCFKPKPSR